MINVTVKKILFYSGSAAPGYTLFLQASDDETRYLPIVVGQFEAQSIALALEQIQLERPMTHDLLLSAIDSLADGLVSVAIVELKEDTFYARLYIQNGEEIESIDARPSDAIALALRVDVPIRVSAKVFNKAAVEMPKAENKKLNKELDYTEKLQIITKQAEIRFDLEKDLREAVSREDYEQAARIRDRLLTLSD